MVGTLVAYIIFYRDIFPKLFSTLSVRGPSIDVNDPRTEGISKL